MAKIILASQSPRRKDLLTWAEIPFEVIVSETTETYPEDLPNKQVPEFIALQKARAVEAILEQDGIVSSNNCIIAADTIVLLNNQVLGKPIDEADAIKSLQQLSGVEHEVITGVVILYNGKLHQFSQITKVKFHSLSIEQIRFYVSKYKPYDKAGAYAIQEWVGVVGIESIQGDFYNVMGLPISLVVQKLQELAIL